MANELRGLASLGTLRKNKQHWGWSKNIVAYKKKAFNVIPFFAIISNVLLLPRKYLVRLVVF